MATKPICKIDGCDKTSIVRGWCAAHYTRWQRHGDPLKGGTASGAPQAYLRDHILAVETDECIAWPFGHSKRGYAEISHGGGKTWVSRVVCKAVNGPPPSPKHHAAHECGNAWCCNKRHLAWKTAIENEADKDRHGTKPLGERHPASKLTVDAVRSIRRRYPSVTQTALAAEYGVRQCTINEIVHRKIWAWVND
jgi:hypothetical protein